MSDTPDILRITIPLTHRRRNGRPRIQPPAEYTAEHDRGTDPHIMRAIALAWSWKRKLDTGEMSCNQDIATAENFTAAYVGRVLRLAYLAPNVLHRLLVDRTSPSARLKDLWYATDLPWAEQEEAIFGN
ncbi:MAG: hypothetical protein RL268_103 [Pseudomonadota bacterium]|jgi:hypothetical protein